MIIVILQIQPRCEIQHLLYLHKDRNGMMIKLIDYFSFNDTRNVKLMPINLVDSMNFVAHIYIQLVIYKNGQTVFFILQYSNKYEDIA